MKLNDIKSKIADLNKEQAATEQLVKDLPEGFPEPDSLCWHHSSLCEYSMTYHFKDLDEARAMVDRFAGYILPLFLYRGTFTGFRTPEHKLSEWEQGKNETRPVMPITVNVSSFGLKFEFYALVNGHLLSIDVESEFRSGFERFASVCRQVTRGTSRTGRDTERVDKSVTILSAPAFVGYQRIKWWGSGDYPNDYTLYWPKGYQFDDIFTTSEESK